MGIRGEHPGKVAGGGARPGAAGGAFGVSRQTVTKWESGETSPDLEHAAALADFIVSSFHQMLF